MTYHWFYLKKGNIIGYDGFNRIIGTRIYVVLESNGLPILIVISSSNQYDSTRLMKVIKSISKYLHDGIIEQITLVYADNIYNGKII